MRTRVCVGKRRRGGKEGGKCLLSLCACASRRSAPAGARLRGSGGRSGSRETCPSSRAATQAQQGPPGTGEAERGRL